MNETTCAYCLGTYDSIKSGMFTAGPFRTLGQAKEEWGGEVSPYILKCSSDDTRKIVCQWKDGQWEDVSHVDLTGK